MFTINTNMGSLTTQVSLRQNDSAMQTSMERLASGLRINSAKDDSAGLAISTRMESQIRGLDTSVRNMNDGISIMQTAEGALGEMVSNLQRVRELSVQAANDTNGDVERNAIQVEVDQLLSEIDRTIYATEYNGTQVFSGITRFADLDVEEKAILNNLRTSWMAQSESLITEYFGITADDIDLTIVLDDEIDGNAAAFVSGSPGGDNGTLVNLELHIDMATALAAPVSGEAWPNDSMDRLIAHEMVHAVMAVTMNYESLTNWFREGTADFLPGYDERLTVFGGSAAAVQGEFTANNELTSIDSADWDVTQENYGASFAAVRFLHTQTTDGSGIKGIMEHLNQNEGSTLDDAIAAKTVYGSVAAFEADFTGAAGSAFINGMLSQAADQDTGGVGGEQADGGDRDTSPSGTIPDVDNYQDEPLNGFNEVWPDSVNVAGDRITYSLQVGANSGETLDTYISRLDMQKLGLEDNRGQSLIDLTSDPAEAINIIDKALGMITEDRARYGAIQNRITSAQQVAQVNSTSMSASASRIKDTDYALESTTLARSSLMSQSAMAMLTQANSTPQLVLSLLA